MFKPPFRYIDGPELSEIIKDPTKQPWRDYVVVDVRDDDYAGGNIKGAHNSPSNNFLVDVDKLVERTKDVPIVVFHCALSQARGPKSARIFAESRDAHLPEEEESPQEVLVLRGGFTEFQAQFKNDATLVENWDKDVWASDWS